MLTRTQHMTVEQFDTFALQPENADRNLQYIGGEVIEMVSNPLSSKVALKVSLFLGIYLLENDTGHLTGADGGYRVSGERYIPDVAYISYEKQRVLEYVAGYVESPPDLAVEVVSPGNDERTMPLKVANYLAAGTVVWMVYPLEREVHVFMPGQPGVVYGADDTLDGGALLPGFTLKVSDIFPANVDKDVAE